MVDAMPGVMAVKMPVLMSMELQPTLGWSQLSNWVRILL